MNFCILAIVLSVSSCVAFQMKASFTKTTTSRTSQLNMAKPSDGIVALMTAFSILSLSPVMPVQAANYGGFGSKYSEVINPKDAVLNEETVSSEDVKEGLAKISAYKQAFVDLKADLLKNSQFDAVSAVQSKLNPGSLRTAMNKFNTAFSEDTQRGTDRIIRNVIQDVTELERLTRIKDGKTRSEIKVNVITKRLDTAINSLDELASFLPAK